MKRSQGWRLVACIALMGAFGAADRASAAAVPAAGGLARVADAVKNDARSGDVVLVGRRHGHRGHRHRGHRHHRHHGHFHHRRHRHHHHRRYRHWGYAAPFIGFSYGYSRSCYRNCRWDGGSRRYCRRVC